MSEQINLNKEGGERDYGPFSNDGKDDISSGMKAAIEAATKLEFPPKDDTANPGQDTSKQSQDLAPGNEK